MPGPESRGTGAPLCRGVFSSTPWRMYLTRAPAKNGVSQGSYQRGAQVIMVDTATL